MSGKINWRDKTRLLQVPLAVTIVATLAATPSWTPDRATIDKLEASPRLNDLLKFSNGRQPIVAEYERYYYPYLVDGHRMIRGEFVVPFGSKMKPAGVYIVSSEKEFPIIFDGGCGIVNLVYDVEKAQLVSLACNGLA